MRYSQLQLILEGFSYKPDYELVHKRVSDTHVNAWWHFKRVNTITGEEGWGESGPVTFDLNDPGLTEEAVVRGIWGMTLRLEEHEAREFMRYFDQRPFDPHKRLIRNEVTSEYNS